MRSISVFFVFIFITGCNTNNNENATLKNEVDSLRNELAHTYKPGLGEFMSGIQVHHAKLWFAGKEQNWKLAAFELDEIKEAIDDIKQYNSDRPEVAKIGMIDGPLDSLADAVKRSDAALFTRSFQLLTNTCNNCHHATLHEFNVIKIPDTPPFSNQEFKTLIPSPSPKGKKRD